MSSLQGNLARQGTFYPRRINTYVPAMQYAADVVHGSPFRVSFGTPAIADADGILDGESIAAAGDTDDFLLDELDAPFGRTLTVVASGAATSTVSVHGNDYLGQPMMETMTLNGTTPVAGAKAFKRIRKVTWTGTSGVNIDLGFGNLLGLPYRAIKVLSEEENGAPKATLGTLTAPVDTDPATATTGDPRGRYTTNTTMDGAKEVRATFLVDGYVNASGKGGLHGIKHYHP